MEAYQNGYRAGYDAARRFYGPAARDRLDRIAIATRQLHADIEAAGGKPPAALLRYLDEVLNNATADDWLKPQPAQRTTEAR